MIQKSKILLLSLLIIVACKKQISSSKPAEEVGGNTDCNADEAALTEQTLPQDVEQRRAAMAKLRTPLVLMYHDIRLVKQASAHPKMCGPFDATLNSDDADTLSDLDDFDLSCVAMKDQLQYLKDQNYTTLSLDEFSKIKSSDSPAPEKAILLTFDDGYAGNYKYAVPELRKHNFKAAFFVHTDYVGIQPGNPNRKTSRHHMTWEQLKNLEDDPLFEVQSHTLTHPDLSKANLKNLTKELSESRLAVESKLGGKRPYFAYPFGLHNKTTVACTKKFYSLAFTINNLQTLWDPLMQVPRFEVHTSKSTGDFFKCRVHYYMLGYSEDDLQKDCAK